MKSLTLILVLALSAQTVLASEVLAKKMIQTLPNQTLSMEVVVARAISSSDSYRAAVAGLEAVDALLLSAKAPLDPRITLAYQRLRNNNEGSNGFSPNRVDADLTQVQISKYFQTGTLLSAELSQSNNSIGFPTGSVVNTPPYHESKLGFSLSQSLWADALGAGTRSGLEAGVLATQANKLQTRESREQWFMSFTDLYYNAWLAQARARAAASSLVRREKLVSITRLKAQRGTAEAPDVLQVESVRLQAANNKELAEQFLADLWRNLVLVLKMPDSLLQLDPLIVPLRLEDTNDNAFKICGPENQLNVTPAQSSNLKRSTFLAEVAKLNLDKARWTAKPDVKLKFSYNPNGIDPDASASLQEVERSKNPQWSVGVVATMPLWFSGERAQLHGARAESIVRDVNKLAAQDNLRAEWVNSCRSLYRIDRALKNDRQALENQSRRASLEEQRFRIGRSTTMAVVQAGDDLVAAELNLKDTEVNRRKIVWRVLQLTDQLTPAIDEIAKQDHLPRDFNL